MADLICVDWLDEHLENEAVKLLDYTWTLPGENTPLPAGYIPGSQYFDIDKIADLSSHMKHMLPSAQGFTVAMSEIGIKNSDHVICYDRHGIRSAPRVWWTFKTFGHRNVSILDGGLPSWIKASKALVSDLITPESSGEYVVKAPLIKVANANLVFKSMNTENQIVDARPAGRFTGKTPEPRAGLRSGRIPGSLSFPFGQTLASDGTYLSLSNLANLVGEAGISLEHPIITSCGSGVTAAGIAHVFYRLGARDISLYDGSWTEWGASELPVEL